MNGIEAMKEADGMVFVVDDDISIRESVENLVRSVGLRAEVFASAEEFLRSKRPDVPGCLVLDVQLPGLSGLDLQNRMAEIALEIPIIFITGHGDIPTSVRAMKAGAVAFLIKPFGDHDLIDAIQQGIERDRLTRRRLAKLTEANEALRRCLDALASVRELDDFLGQVMAAITRQLGAVSSLLRVRNFEQNTLPVELVFQDGRLMTPDEAKFPDYWRSLSLVEQRAACFLDQPTTVTRIRSSPISVQHLRQNKWASIWRLAWPLSAKRPCPQRERGPSRSELLRRGRKRTPRSGLRPASSINRMSGVITRE
jgi:FixJ family two-component response regulator